MKQVVQLHSLEAAPCNFGHLTRSPQVFPICTWSVQRLGTKEAHHTVGQICRGWYLCEGYEEGTRRVRGGYKVYEEDTRRIRGGYVDGTWRVRGGYEEDTRRVQGGYIEDTRRIRGGYEEGSLRIRYEEDTRRIQGGYIEDKIRGGYKECTLSKRSP